MRKGRDMFQVVFVHVLNTRIQLTMSRRERDKYLARWCFVFGYIPWPNKFAITSCHSRETSFLRYYTATQKRTTEVQLSLPSLRDITRDRLRNGVHNWTWTSACHCLWPGCFCINLLLSNNSVKSIDSPETSCVLHPRKIKHQLQPLDNQNLIKRFFLQQKLLQETKKNL